MSKKKEYKKRMGIREIMDYSLKKIGKILVRKTEKGLKLMTQEEIDEFIDEKGKIKKKSKKY